MNSTSDLDQAAGLRQWAEEKAPVRATTSKLRVLTVTSGKGGVGKSNLTANVAVSLAKTGKRVLILDADLGLANVEILFGIKPHFHLGHLLDGSATLEQVLTQAYPGVDVLPGGSGVNSLTRLTDEQKLALTASLDTLEDRYDVVLVDSGAGIGDNVLFFASAAQQTLLVVSPEPTSLTDAYATVKVLSQQAGVTDFEVVVNCAGSEAEARATYERLSSVTVRFLKAHLRFAGHVPRDPNVQRAVMAQRPLCDLSPLAPASRAYSILAARIVQGPPPQMGGGLKFLWNRLLRDSAEREA